jgi:dienelactone hydrolase
MVRSRVWLLSICLAASAAAQETQVQPAERRVVIANEGWRLVGDLTLPGADAGRRVPAVLMLNGAGRDRSDYAALSRRLAALGIASLRLDLRAMGESTNHGRFIPFDTTGHNQSLGLERGWSDVQAALRYLGSIARVDSTRLGAMGASFSGEELALAIRGRSRPRAIVALSPGSFSDSSLAAIDSDGRRWLFVYSAREMIVRRRQMDHWTRRGSRRARVLVVPDSAHASQMLSNVPFLEARLAEWFSRALGAERPDDNWRVAAGRVAALMEPGRDDLLRPDSSTASLGDGAAGRLHFLLARHVRAGDQGSRRAATRAADQLLALLPPGGEGADVSLYRGMAGPAYILLGAADVLNDPRYGDRARALIGRISAFRDSAPSGANDVLFGEAGTAAFMHAAARMLEDTTLRNRAFGMGRALLARGRPDSGGINWRWRETAPLILPNYSHGAAGVGTVMALLGRDIDAPSDFRAAALGAGTYVRAVARRDSSGFRIPYGWPIPQSGWGRPFDASWGHGQAGSARLFWSLWLATRDTAHLSVVTDMVRAIDVANVLGAPHPDYGTAPFGVDYRFGLTGIADLFADLYDETGDRQYLERAIVLAREVRRRADGGSGPLGWTVPRPAFLPFPGEPSLMTGLLHGAAGPGLLFLKLDALLSGRRPPMALPDSPFRAQ